MRSFNILPLLGAAAYFTASTPVFAQDNYHTVYYVCRATKDNTVWMSNIYVSKDPRSWGGTKAPDFQKEAFEDYVRVKTGVTGYIDAYCSGSTASDQTQLSHDAYREQGRPTVVLDWRGANPIAGDMAITEPASPGSLTIEDNGIATRTKAWDNHLLQVQREEAAHKLAKAAATAESKAEYARIMAKVIADLKKRGNKQ